MRDLMYYKHFQKIEDGEFRGEENTSTPSLVDTKGYIPLQKQVERAVLAGERLEAFRRMEFDVDADSDHWKEPSVLQDPDFIPSTDMQSAMESNLSNLNKATSALQRDAASDSVKSSSDVEQSDAASSNA